MKNSDILKYKADLDAIAETGWNEVKTTAYIDSVIKQKPLVNGFGEKKVGRIFKIGEGSQKIFLRADIDALPTKGGVKHICGHSTHTASLLGAFQWALLKEQELTKNDKQIIFIFQPAEETFPSGAAEIIKSNPELLGSCKYGFGIHVSPDLPEGTICIQDGIINAAGDYIEIEVKGKSIHVKSTPKGIDAMEGAAYVIQEFKNFQKTFENFGNDVVFNLDTIKGGTSPNRVADYVFMNGDIRWFNDEDYKKIRTFTDRLPQLISQRYKGEIKIKYFNGYPPLKNNTELTKVIKDYLKSNSDLRITDSMQRSLGTEDFSFYSEKIPTLYAKIGTAGIYELHDDNFDVQNEALVTAYKYWSDIIKWFTSVSV